MIEIKSSEPNVIIRKNNEELRRRLSSISFISQNPLDDVDENALRRIYEYARRISESL